MEYRYVTNISSGAILKSQVFQLLQETEGEFVPPLHVRSSTTQKELAGKRWLSEEEKENNLEAYFREMSGQRFIVAQEGETVLGFLSFKPELPMEVDGRNLIANYISTIVVRPGERNKGIGSGMYRRLIEVMGESGFFVTRTWETNTFHQQILDRLGFRLLSRIDEGRKDADGTPVPSLYYIKEFNRMNDKPAPINPFLAEKLKEYRAKTSEKEMRADYEKACNFYVSAGIKRSWEEHQAARALRYSMLSSPWFLETLRTDMELPQETIDNLYWCHVDTVADLLQITEEELRTLGLNIELDIDAIKKYLGRNGYLMYRSADLTFKVPALDALNGRNEKWSTWMLDANGLKTDFDIFRPTLQEKWLDEFYKRERIDGEEKLLKDLLPVKPECKNGNLPEDYTEFSQAIKNLWDSYEAICANCHIPQRISRPIDLPESPKDLGAFSNDRFYYIWKDAVKVMVDIFERTSLFKKSSAGKYMLASDEGKLNLAEGEEDQDFQLLLITYVEVRIDIDNIILFLDKYKNTPRKHSLNEKPDPVNPWLAERIKEYRHDYKEEYIRKRYVSYLDEDPDSSWSDFIAVAALQHKIRRDPFLMTRRKDFGFSEHLTDVMNILGVDIFADLLQFTVEEMKELCEQEGEEIGTISAFVNEHGYHLEHYDGYTLKYPLPEVEEERKQQVGVIRDHCSEAEGRMKRNDELLGTRLEHALAIYRSGLHLARACDLPLKTQLDVLIDMGRLMEEHIEAFPVLTRDAPEIAERAIYCSELVHGPKGKKTAGCHRLYGAILSKLKRHNEAAGQYSAAAAIAKEYEGPEGLWVGKDLRSAAVCNTRIPDYEKALDLFLQAATVFKKHPDDPRELEETYWNIAECYRSLGDKDKEETYRLLAAAIRTTDEI